MNVTVMYQVAKIIVLFRGDISFPDCENENYTGVSDSRMELVLQIKG